MNVDIFCDEIFGDSRVNGGPIQWDGKGGLFDDEFLGETQTAQQPAMDVDRLADTIFGDSRVNGGPIQWDGKGGLFPDEFLGE